MNKQRIALYLERLRNALNDLENEIKSDDNSLEAVDYQDILWYYENQENQEEHF